jgi:large subunit ribosomal protein L22
MGYQAKHRFARISARKVRPLADMIRGKRADEALDLLRYQPQRGARMLEKVIKSALANAEDRRARNIRKLRVVDARVDGGPMFKRIRPRARGMAHVIKKRTSHIHIELD